jgi:hypothetical protein
VRPRRKPTPIKVAAVHAAVISRFMILPSCAGGPWSGHSTIEPPKIRARDRRMLPAHEGATTMRSALHLIIVTSVLATAHDVFGDTIAIENAGFEEPVLVDDDFLFPAPGWDSYNPDDIGIGHGCWNPPADAYPLEAPQGSNIGYIFFSIIEPEKVLGMQQTLDATLQPDTTYTLSARVGDAHGYDAFPALAGFPGYRIELLAGDTVLVADDNTLQIEEGSFGVSTISYTASADDPRLGTPLTIRLINLLNAPGAEVDFDDLSLTTEPAVPCPWDLDGSGTVGISELLSLLAAWGPNPGHPADFDDDGTIGIADLLELLANWGACP